MKKIIFPAAVLMFLVLNVSNKAQDKGFGVGVIIGQPTGFSAKNWINSVNAIDFGLGFSFAKDDNRVHIHSDYLWHNYSLIQSTERFALYYGPGLKLRTGKSNDAELGVRGVLGLEWLSQRIPLDVFIEVAPVFNFVPGTGFKMDAGFGARYYFQ